MRLQKALDVASQLRIVAARRIDIRGALGGGIFSRAARKIDSTVERLSMTRLLGLGFRETVRRNRAFPLRPV
jgi:hypothetical protein